MGRARWARAIHQRACCACSRLKGNVWKHTGHMVKFCCGRRSAVSALYSSRAGHVTSADIARRPAPGDLKRAQRAQADPQRAWVNGVAPEERLEIYNGHAIGSIKELLIDDTHMVVTPWQLLLCGGFAVEILVASKEFVLKQSKLSGRLCRGKQINTIRQFPRNVNCFATSRRDLPWKSLGPARHSY